MFHLCLYHTILYLYNNYLIIRITIAKTMYSLRIKKKASVTPVLQSINLALKPNGKMHPTATNLPTSLEHQGKTQAWKRTQQRWHRSAVGCHVPWGICLGHGPLELGSMELGMTSTRWPSELLTPA